MDTHDGANIEELFKEATLRRNLPTVVQFLRDLSEQVKRHEMRLDALTRPVDEHNSVDNAPDSDSRSVASSHLYVDADVLNEDSVRLVDTLSMRLALL